MQRIIYLLCISLFLTSCTKEKTEGFVVNGTLDNAKNNSLVQLIRTEARKNIILDSTRVTENSFTLTGKVDKPDMYYIQIEGVRGNLPFIVENESIDIKIPTDSIYASSIKGGKENDYYNEYQAFIKTLRFKNNKLAEEFKIAQRKSDTSKITSIQQEFQGLMKENDANDLDFMTTNKDALLSALLLERAIMTNKLEYNKIKELYTNFDETIKNTRPGKKIATFIIENKKTAIGSVVPDFSGPNPEGKTIALNAIKGKVTIIDFWAAWCGPCRKENPNVVNVYEKYHNKGLEIIGVSLDGTPQQKDAKQAWIDAIEKDNLNWHHVSNLQYFNDPIAKEFNINAIPATFIIDAEGKIVAKNLRGPALEEKIAALLD
ncbi:TlpA disulfide reductase family protein [Oceanihabitans sp. 2_MG-2023]|uniref:TlpA disulfide reductase family protein n=1 Tax=Oceanihabitans sp. 2_MG-2023 TaxID=3062661 RepID=UPI0026E30724|nr:TlpA disulfide reductase family protein [Oceanihabitans sp. 2_MG-2023]MDO6597373.1 TlpA disulfide reductase family protein [Oceanihabitans sp. 2_MG-2023]